VRKLPANSHSSVPTATAPVVDSTPQSLLVPNRQADFGLCRTVREELVGHQHIGREALFLEQPAHQFHRCGFIAPSLHKEVENLAFVVNRAPEPELLARNRYGHLIEMPSRCWPWASTAKFSANNGPNFKTHRRTVS
jgi:hypothetical protein